MSAEIASQLVLLLVSGVPADEAEEIAVAKMGLDRAQAKAAVIDARERITIAASFNRVVEIGTAYIRCNDLYTRSLQSHPQTALAAQKELNKLMRLYDPVPPGSAGEDSAGSLDAQELKAIADHLLPLDLAPKEYPLHEHARIAADRIRKQGGR